MPAGVRLGWLAYFLLSRIDNLRNVTRCRERMVMDALDEFFRIWCKPEAWCEHCGLHPAIHVVVQDTKDAFESVVTYIRIWDPHTQSHIAVCRQCSIAHLDALKMPLWPPPIATSMWQRCCDRSTALWQWFSQHVQRAKQYLRQQLYRCSKRPPVQQNQTDTDNYIRSET